MRKRLALLMASLFLLVGAVWAEIPTNWDSPTPWVKSNFVTPSGLSTLASGKNVALLEVPVQVTGTEISVDLKWSGGSCALNVLGVDLVNRKTGEVVKSHYESKKTGGDRNKITYTLSDLTATEGCILRFFAWYSKDDRLEDSRGTISITGVGEPTFAYPTIGKVYRLKCKHDATFVYDDANASNRLKPTAKNAEAAENQYWVLSEVSEGKYALRNVATKGYMKPGGQGDNQPWYTNETSSVLYIVGRTAAEGGNPAYFNLTGTANADVTTKVFLHCYQGQDGKSWTGEGGGSQFAFVETGKTIATLATEAITNVLTPLITDANELAGNDVLATSTTELTALTDALTSANALKNKAAWEAKDWDAVLATVDALTEAIAAANAYIAANPGGPSLEETNLYALQSPTGTYFNFTAVTTTDWSGSNTTPASFQSTPNFFYKKASGNNWKFQNFEDETKFIGSTHGWNVTTEESAWYISESDANGLVEISRPNTESNEKHLGHDGNTNVGTGIFTNVGGQCNKWKLIPAYPITIVYKNGEEEIRTVKAAAMSGEPYTFDIDLNGGTLVSCTTDKGTATLENNRYTIAAVNGATTVTVTLTLPTAPFAPEVGKAYVLKVVGTDKYLDIRTLGNDDPNASGSNNISTSTKPYPIYFEQSQNGTWKMKNANGKYVGLYPDKAWDPVIGASSHDWTMAGNASNFTIARESGKYINYNTDADADKVAGKPLYCDKGTGLQFRLVDYNDVDFITGAGLGKEGAESPYVSIKEIDAEGTTTSIPTGMGWVLTIEVENPNGASHGQWGSSILATGKEPFPYKDKHNGFQLYLQSGTNGAKKLDVVFGNADHIVNNVSYSGDFSAVISYDGTGKLQVKTTNANGDEETNNYDVRLPEISEFAYGLPTGINIKRLAIETIDREYTFAIGETPNDQEVTVTYNGEALAVGDIIVESELNLDLFGATEIEGYTWNVIADKETNTITLNYTEVEVLDLQAVKDLVNRIGGEGTADKFKFVHTPWLNSKQETFVLGAEEGKILIKGTTISAITTGLGWYLNNVAKINIAWNSLNEKTVSGAAYADLSNLPIPTTEETHTSDAKYRYYLNTCTFGYSMTSWTWKRWQQEIDWMALHGINMPLQLVGLEEVWRKFLINQGYSETDAKAFVAGPAFIAWWAMNNLQGWGGTAAGSKSSYNNLPGAGGVQDDAWYARQVKLAKQILEAQRALGMQPVLPGWSGMVPTNFASKSTGKYATRGNGGNWAGDFVRPLLLSVNNANYAEIAADYYACLEEVMGESQYYSMDPFHEGGGAGTMEDYKALYAAMEAAKPGSQWVIQQWQWSATQKYSLTAVPAGKLVVLDLFSDGSPAFDGYNGYAPQDAVFCAIPNFGGRSGLMGRLQNVTENYFKFKAKYASIKGIGTAPEAIEQTPVTYDLIYQLPWMNGVKPNVAEWVDNYAVARYGKNNSIVKEAWSLLRQGPLNYGADGIQGPVEDVWAARPNLNANPASFWGKTMNNAIGTYTKERHQMLIDAVYKLIDQEDELALTDGSVYKSNYLYDLVEFGGGVMADYAYYLLKGIKEAKDASNTALYEARRDAFLQLILDMDAFRGTNLNFRLGKWTQEARDAATEVEGATTATPDWYEYNNARTILSTWSSPGTNLTDYSYRSWQGLLKDFYYKRWKYYFDNNCNGGQYEYFEWNWAHGMTHKVGDTGFSNTPLQPGEQGHTDNYTREPEGNTVEVAKSMFAKYIIPVKYNDGTTYYAYRTFTTDLTGKATVNTASGSTVDFTQYFNVPADATITGDFINNDKQSANIMAVPTVKPQEGKSYTGTITLTDGTVLQNFTVVLKEQLINGYYYINYISEESEVPMFIGYDETQDNWEKPIVEFRGYKILGEGKFTTDAVADKVFAIITKGDGFSITAQGKNLKAPNFNGWNHIQFSDDGNEAGVYQFINQSELKSVYKIKGLGKGESGPNDYLQFYGDVAIVGPNPEIKASLFKLVPATTYAIAQGMTALCLPFNVVLPEGVVAYDIVNASKEALESGENLLEEIASEGDILLAGTPVILRADNATALTITLGSNGGKTSKANSCLRGNFVKQDLKVEEKKKYVLQEGKFVPLTVDTEISANTCWVVTDIDDENATIKPGHIIIDGWDFTYTEEEEEAAKGRITLVGCEKVGDPELDIESTYIVNGEKKTVVAIDPKFLHRNETLTKVTIPESMLNLGFREIEPMFKGEYQGEEGDGATYEGNQLVGEAKGLNRCYEFPTDTTTGKSYVVGGNDAWKLTLDVTIDDTDTKKTSFNNYGSAIVSTKENTMDDNYQDYMQIYMWKDLQHIVVKIDNSDDRYAYSTYVLDEDGNETSELLVNKHFTFELEHDGAGGYQVVIYYDNGKAKMYNIAASDGHKVQDFDKLYFSLPEGIKVDVKFEKLITHGLFVGCTNLQRIEVDPANPTFMSCEHGVLYDKNQYYVMRIPEGKRNEDGKTDHFEIPSKVVKLYPGAVHGVTADVVLHSNPQIGVVEGHGDDVKNVKFYLSLDDIDNTITEKETGYGGARDFVSANKNTYQAARYKRAPLGDGKMGTICLPFAIAENNAIMQKYDFYKLKGGNSSSLTFTQVTELVANEPYLYRWKTNPVELTESADGGVFDNEQVVGLDIFETTDSFTVQTKDKYDPNSHKSGTREALGAFVNYYLDADQNTTGSSFYIYQSSTNKFHRVTKRLTYRPYRAFFVVTPETGQQAQAPSRLNLELLDGTTTSIDASLVEGMEAPEYYDLSGRRVLNPVSGGIYIVNGQKVVLK